MDQESKKREPAEETELQPPSLPALCANNCGFFGSAATNNLCSKCYRDHFLAKSKASLPLPPPPSSNIAESAADDYEENAVEVEPSGASSASASAPAPKKPSNRCSFCKKKVGLMGFKCRCGEVFCPVHRYSDKHGCAFDYRGAGQEAIAKANPVLKADKVEKI